MLCTFDLVNSWAWGTNASGAYPEGAPLLSGTTLYGTAEYGGLYGNGTIYKFDLAPTITGLTLGESNSVITAKNGVAGATYYLRTSADLSLPFDQWTLVGTNQLNAGSSFTITNTSAIDPGASFSFYVLQVK